MAVVLDVGFGGPKRGPRSSHFPQRVGRLRPVALHFTTIPAGSAQSDTGGSNHQQSTVGLAWSGLVWSASVLWYMAVRPGSRQRERSDAGMAQFERICRLGLDRTLALSGSGVARAHGPALSSRLPIRPILGSVGLVDATKRRTLLSGLVGCNEDRSRSVHTRLAGCVPVCPCVRVSVCLCACV